MSEAGKKEMESKVVDLGIDFEQVVLNINGDPMKNEDGEDLRLGDVCCSALIASVPGDEKLDGVQKLKLFQLASKIKGSAEDDSYPRVKLNSTRKKRIEDRVVKIYPVTIYARVYEALEGELPPDDD